MQAKGVVINTVANAYRDATESSDVVSQAGLGMELSIWETREGWYYVRMPDDYPGWIEASSVRLYGADEPAYASSGQVARVDNLFAFIYLEPSVTQHAPAERATIGARLEVVDSRDEWVQVRLPDLSIRWVQAGDVVMESGAEAQNRQSVEQVIATAKRFLGLPYQWGGTTPLGIDCSGFVQLVYRLNGVRLLRDADMQYDQPGLAAVDKAGLQPGDLLFFGQSSVSHVGMYIGNGEFIHATTHEHPVVQISRLEEPHWTSLFLGARRP